MTAHLRRGEGRIRVRSPGKGGMVRGKDLLQGNLSMGRLRSRRGAMMGRKGKGEERTVQEAPW